MKTINRSSGIKGVTIYEIKGYKYWRSRIQGRLNISKNFPFTKRGKELAAEFYKKTIEQNINNYYNYQKNGLQTSKRNSC